MKRGGGCAVAAGWPAALALCALALLPRLLALGWGLPQVYNADEPHVVNTAVSLAGSLRPHSFKYPTLWPTVLAAAYGLWFVFWSCFGLLRDAVDFAALYAFRPTGFYLIARALSAAAQLAGLWVLAAYECREDRRRWPWAAALLAASPVLVELAHAAKPDSLLFLLCAGAWACALRFAEDGRRGLLWAAGILSGLACSAQYTAAPAALVVPLAWALGPGGPAPFSWLIQSCGLAALGFFLGTPFAALDPARFLAGWSDYAELGDLRPHDAAATARLVLGNLVSFAGGPVGGAAALLGLVVAARRNVRRAALLFVPVGAYSVLLSASFDGGVPRYMLGAYPALALLAGEGLALLGGESRVRRALAAALALAPGFWLSARFDAELLRPDTRAQAAEWLARRAPPGAVLLLDQPHASPAALMERDQCADLAARAARRGSPRAALYRAMAARHPGGGWRIYRIRRSAADLWSAPRHAADSQADGDFLDVRPGLDSARAARVDWIVASSYGADPRRSPELAAFFEELSRQAKLEREFPSGPGAAAGPWLRVYRLRHN
ncbi:MAG: glycosyltransferase family 39 protein [Elusimicrobia bacterium]|nr:glycosyltransferase family 39 protein [Elusimicrobiota bacterium]